MVTAKFPLHSTPKPSDWQGAALSSLILLCLTVIFFWPQLGAGRALYWGDIGLYFTPMSEFLRENLRHGRIPLWNPLLLCGTPYVGNPQTWPFYPLTGLLPFVPAPYFLSLSVALHVWLAGVGTWLFLRRILRLRKGAAMLGAITFMFSGWLVSKEQFPNMVQASAYLPWVLWGVSRLAASDSGRKESLTLGLILGLQLLAAHAQMTLLTLYLALAWGVYLAFPLLRSRFQEEIKRIAGRASVAALVAFGLSSVQVLPTMQLFHDGWRQDMSFAVVNRFFLPLNQIANWVLPTLHGDPMQGDFTGRGNFWETCCYAGLIPFALAAAGTIAAWRGNSSRDRFWSITFAVAVLMALGGGVSNCIGPYWLAYKILPGFHSFHDPARCLIWATFALAVLAGLGMNTLIPRLSRRQWLLPLIVLLAFADLAHFGQGIYPLVRPSTLFPMTHTLSVLKDDPDIGSGQARFLAPDSARVWQRFTSHRSYRQKQPDYQSLWEDTLTPNLPMAYGLSDAYGYEPVTRRDAQQVIGDVNADFAPNAPAALRHKAAFAAGLLGVRYIATDRASLPDATLPGLALLFTDASLSALDSQTERSRVGLSFNSRWQPRARVIAQLDSTRSVASPVTIVRDQPDQVIVEASIKAPAYLLLADTDAPGWTATVDGHPAAIHRADGILRAVALARPGAHQIVFQYRPVMFLLGLYLTLLTISILLGIWFYDRKRAGHSNAVSPDTLF